MDELKGYERYREETLQYLHEAREQGLNKSEDFKKQQDLYSKHAKDYDDWGTHDEYNAPNFTATKVKQLYPNQKDIKILDYGCGTGLTTDCLFEYDYTNVDGLDPCKEFLDVARSKGKMKNCFELGSEDDDSLIPSDEYDVVCSSGVFFASPSHPGFECIPKICRYVKPGGYIVICTGNKYLETINPDGNSVLKDLVEQKILEIKPKEVLDNYRKSKKEVEGDIPIKGAILVYQVL